MVDVLKLMEAGHAARQVEKAEQELLKRGNLRAGSAGCVGADGLVYGLCHRKALARLEGVETEKSIGTLITFQQGEKNEDSWKDVLLKSWPGTIKCETEIPISFDVNGTLVTGRPDMILCSKDGEPEFGLELKAVCSYSTAKTIWLEGKPKDEHLCQSGIYSMTLGIPYALAYSNGNVFPVDNFFDKKRFPGVKKILPGYKVFYLQWTDGFLEYRENDVNEWTRTAISQQGLKDYYSLVLELRDKKVTGPRPADKDVVGEQHPYDHCKYCDFNKACDNHEDSFGDWIEAAKK